MKNSVVFVAALVSAGVASAQSNVTMFGVVDTDISGFRMQSRTPSGATTNVTQIGLDSNGLNTSRIGFRGDEDLGGGLAAGFWLEAGFLSNNGLDGINAPGLYFQRRSTVSLSSVVFGELRLGRDYTPTFWNDNLFDPFNGNGVGSSLIATANGGTSQGVQNSGFQTNRNYLRASNTVGYFLPPTLGGFYGQFMYAFNEQTSYDPGGLTPPGAAAVVAKPALATVADNARAGGYIGGRFGYADGPLNVALAYAQSTLGSNYYLGSTTTLDIWNFGASYDFAVVKLFGEYSNNKQNTSLAVNAFNPFGTTKPGANGGLIGVIVPIRSSQIRASYSAVRYNNASSSVTGAPTPVGVNTAQPKADQFALGYVYNLSKRTALYATVSYVSNKNGASLGLFDSPAFYTGKIPGAVGAAVPGRAYGYDLGIRHAF